MIPRALTAAAAAFVLAGVGVLVGSWARYRALEILELVDEGRRQDDRELEIADARGRMMRRDSVAV